MPKQPIDQTEDDAWETNGKTAHKPPSLEDEL